MLTIRNKDIPLNENKIRQRLEVSQVFQDLGKIEGMSLTPKVSTENHINNKFISMLHRAYADHLPITLSPDDFWYYICYGFSRHINLNAEKLRDKFVDFDGKKTLIVRRDNFIKGKENDWESVFAEFSEQISANVGKIRDVVVTEYSTTRAIEKVAFEICLMDAMQQYFAYIVKTKCGIPLINVLGDKADWIELKNKFNMLAEYNLSWWVDRLNPVLDNIIKSFGGTADNEFWDSIYKYSDPGSGGPTISGWVNELFPYVVKGTGFERCWAMVVKRNRIYSTTTVFPSSICKVPFVWEYYDKNFNMNFAAGHVGYVQEEDMSLKMQMGWAVLENK